MGKRIIILMNVFMPILIGLIIYSLLCPDLVFIKMITNITGLKIRVTGLENTFIRNYLPDLLWAYSLLFALLFINNNGTAGLKKIFLVSVIFSALVEFLQKLFIIRGTFDIGDIIVEIIGEVIAVLIIKKLYYRKGAENEI